VADDDLLACAHTPKQVRKEVAGVPGVVLGKLAWVGVAMWRGLATPPEEPLQHASIVDANPIRE